MVQVQDGKAAVQSISQHVFDHLAVDGRVTDDAVFSDLLPARLELGLDEAHHRRAILQQGCRWAQDMFQRDKRHVGARKIHPIREIRRLRVPEVVLFHTHDPLVAAQLPDQLVRAAVHGVDLTGAPLQHAVRKPAGGGTDIDADEPLHVQTEAVQRPFQL